MGAVAAAAPGMLWLRWNFQPGSSVLWIRSAGDGVGGQGGRWVSGVGREWVWVGVQVSVTELNTGGGCLGTRCGGGGVRRQLQILEHHVL